MASNDSSGPSKSRKSSSSNQRAKIDSENQWLLLPNNLELRTLTKSSNKQRNKEKHKENISNEPENFAALSGAFQNFPQAKSNTAAWLKDQFMNEDKTNHKSYDSEEVFSDSDHPQSHQHNPSYPTNEAFSDIEHAEYHLPIQRSNLENENFKSDKDEILSLIKKRKSAIVCDLLEFITATETEWDKLDLPDDPEIRKSLVHLKHSIKAYEDARGYKIHHLTSENGLMNDVSRSSSTSRLSSSRENVVNRDSSSMSAALNREEEHTRYSHLYENLVPENESPSTDHSVSDAEERVSAVELERKKLKNKLIELQEEKKNKACLVRDLSSRKDASHSTLCSDYPKATDPKKKKPSKYQSHSQQPKVSKDSSSDENQNSINESSEIPIAQVPPRRYALSSLKDDNVRIEQNSAFPARRHYEAEGRANEDTDVPAVGATASVAAANAASASPALDNSEIQAIDLKRLRTAQQHVRMIKDIVVSAVKTGKKPAFPADLPEQHGPQNQSEMFTSDRERDSDGESDHEPEMPQARHLNSFETAANAKDVSDGLQTPLVDVDGHKHEEKMQVDPAGLMSGSGKTSDLSKLPYHFQYLMQLFPDIRDDDPVRSCGEGAQTQKKNPNISQETVQKTPSLRTMPHPDNLALTRQNVVHSETQNSISNSHFCRRDCNSVRKDINNLSGKTGKLSVQSSMIGSYPDVLNGSNTNLDTHSTISNELNSNHSFSNEGERKTILDILKSDKKKQKQYDRNQDKGCNSSIESEPLESLNSALAVDSTTNAAWGGSSTHETFDDDNEENHGSLEQDDEENSCLFRGRRSARYYSDPVSNMHQYVQSVSNDSGKRPRNFSQQIYNRNPRQPVVCQEYPLLSTGKSSRNPGSPIANVRLSGDFQDSCSTDASEHCYKHDESTKFIRQLKNQLDQLNILFQSQLSFERSQTPSYCQPNQGYRFLNNYDPAEHNPECSQPSLQQLLLCINQCYHALHMQQQEIQQLQRCVWHNIDAGNVQQPSHLNSRNTEDLFRPYSAPTWINSFGATSNYPPDMPILSSNSCFPVKPYPPQNSLYSPMPVPQPARAVIHPTSHNNLSSQETLNNQVPPRTRANNFWDNFRSYSRQNLLSTANTSKRNENFSSLPAPQVRQVHPLVSNEIQNSMPDISSTCCNAASLFGHTIPESRSTQNADIQGVVGFSQKLKTNVPCIGTFPKQNMTCQSFQNGRPNKPRRLNIGNSRISPVSNSNSSNLVQPPSNQENPKTRVSLPATDQNTCHLVSASSNSNASNVKSNEPLPDFLVELLHEAQSLKSIALRQKALKIIKALAISDQQIQTSVKTDIVPPTVPSQASMKSPCDNVGAEVNVPERPIVKPEAALGNIQNLPTATISPLSKHDTTKMGATGAIRKKANVSSGASVSQSGHASNQSSQNASDSSEHVPVLTLKKTEDMPGFISEKVLSDLIAIMHPLKIRFLRDGCSQTFWTSIKDCLNESLKMHMFYCHIKLSRKSVLELHQTINHFISLFSGITVSDFNSIFLKYLEGFIYENVTCFVANGHFVAVPSFLDEENFSLDIHNKMQNSNLKLHSSGSVQLKEPVHKMPLDEGANFSTHCKATQQNLFESSCSFENIEPDPLLGSEYAGAVEDFGCGCPEAEIEPEVEIGTEADLAEADQSPGQQGSVNDSLPSAENWFIDQASPAVKNDTLLTQSSEAFSAEFQRKMESDLRRRSDEIDSLMLPDHSRIPDDIPIKLCPAKEETSQQSKDQKAMIDQIVDNQDLNSDDCGDGDSS